MTSDTKVGLLLGLVFIVVIAFLMNGLPELLSRNSSSAVTRTTNTGTRALRLDAHADDAVRKVNEEMMDLPFPPRRVNMEENRQKDRRFAAHGKTSDPKYSKPSNNNRSDSQVRVYTVRDGDNLAKIAKNVFGEDVGNKYATIEKIFEVNRDILSSPDEVSVGQKLRMPSLLTPDETVAQYNPESTGMLDKVKGAFNNMVNRPSTREQAKVYVVKDGDSLWKIADEMLFDGSRFVDILKLNRNIIPDGESLSIGMQLNLPKR